MKQKKKYIIAQKPNLPLITWFVSTILLFILPPGMTHEVVKLIAFGSLFTWAWLEIFNGVNLWRKILGTTGMILILLLRII